MIATLLYSHITGPRHVRGPFSLSVCRGVNAIALGRATMLAAWLRHRAEGGPWKGLDDTRPRPDGAERQPASFPGSRKVPTTWVGSRRNQPPAATPPFPAPCLRPRRMITSAARTYARGSQC